MRASAGLSTPGRKWRILSFGAAALSVVAGVIAWSWPRPGPEALLARARSDVQAGRFGTAEEAVARLARLRDPIPIDRMIRAQLAETKGEDERALAELSQVPIGDPSGPLANLLAGRIEVRLGQLRPAERHFRAALDRDPTAPQPRRELAYILALQHRLDELDRQLGALSDLGQLDDKTLVTWSRIRSANWDASGDLEALEKAVEADPDDRRSRLALFEAHLRANRQVEAERVLMPLPEADPDARVLRLSIALARGDQATADSLLAGGPDDHPGLARLRGTRALTRGDGPAAVRDFRIALTVDPGDRATQFGLGTALKLMGRSAEAETLLEAARRHDGVVRLVERVVHAKGFQEVEMPARLGAACEAAGRLGDARAWYRLAIARDPLDEASQRALYRLNSRREGSGKPSGDGDPTEGISSG